MYALVGNGKSVALMAWCVGRTLFNCLNYHGTHISAATKDCFLASMFDDEQKEQIRMCIAAIPVIIFIIDNFQRGQKLKNQRGGRSSIFLEGTNQITEKTFTYSNIEFNNKKQFTELSYDVDQDYPSLWCGMVGLVIDVTISLGLILHQNNGDSSDQAMDQTVTAKASSVMVEAGALHKENKASAHVLYLMTLRLALTS